MFIKLLLPFTLVPLIELALLIKLGQLTSLGTTIMVVILTGVLGAALARREGLKTWLRIQEQLRQGTAPTDELVNALLILIAAAVLITPGLLTDLLGFGLLIPPIRNRVRQRLTRYFSSRIVLTASGPAGGHSERDIFDMPPE